MCPHCRQNAPIVYRGAMAYCTACGKPRVPLMGSGVNTAGRPHKVGGSLARGLGWVTLGVGLSLALMLGALFQAIFPAGVFGYLLAGLIAVFSVGIGLLLMRGGKSLQKSGEEKERFTREQAIFALARNRGGMLSATDVSQALNLPVAAADELLTTFAKEDPERVRLEVDDSGGIYFLFPQIAIAPGARIAGPGVRVADPPDHKSAAASGGPPAANAIFEESPEEEARKKAKTSL